MPVYNSTILPCPHKRTYAVDTHDRIDCADCGETIIEGQQAVRLLDIGRNIPEHEHQNSVYVHCLECQMFGIPLPFKFNQPVPCGNCGSTETVHYFPSCCIIADRKGDGSV